MIERSTSAKRLHLKDLVAPFWIEGQALTALPGSDHGRALLHGVKAHLGAVRGHHWTFEHARQCVDSNCLLVSPYPIRDCRPFQVCGPHCVCGARPHFAGSLPILPPVRDE